MKVRELITYLHAHCDMELDIVLDDGYEGAWNNIYVEPVEKIGYMLMGSNQSIKDPKQLKLPFDGVK